MTDDRLARVSANVALSPFHHWLKPEVVAVADGEVTIRLALRPDFRRSAEADGVHGGVVAALIDITGHATVFAATDHGVPTINIGVDYLRLTVGNELVSRGRPIRIGRSIAVVDIEVAGSDGKLVAVGRGTFATRAG